MGLENVKRRRYRSDKIAELMVGKSFKGFFPAEPFLGTTMRCRWQPGVVALVYVLISSRVFLPNLWVSTTENCVSGAKYILAVRHVMVRGGEEGNVKLSPRRYKVKLRLGEGKRKLW
jgi:hypothetical protein